MSKKVYYLLGIVVVLLVLGLGLFLIKQGLVGSSESQFLMPVLTSTSTNGAGTKIDVGLYRGVACAMDTERTSSYTLKFAGSLSDTAPDFNSAASVSNQWDYIEVVDVEDGNTIDGDTGLTYVNQEDHRMFEVNTNRLNWLTAILSSVTQPTTTTLKCKPFNNQ